MELEPNMLDAFVGWVAEEIAAMALGSIIGAFGARWWFGKKNQEELEQLKKSITELEREQTARPLPERSAAASQTPQTPSPAPQSPLNHSALESRTLPPSPLDALLSPQELIDLVAGHTSMAAKRMLEPHRGRRYVVTGTVREVTENINTVAVIIALADGILVSLSFDNGPRNEELVVLRQGDEISASGLLRSAGNNIMLKKCSLVEVSAQSRS